MSWQRTSSTLDELLMCAVQQAPEQPSLVRGTGPGAAVVTYAELAAEVERVADGLSDLGVGQGVRVGLWLPSIPEYLVLQFALARLGATAIGLNTRFRVREVRAVLERASPQLVAVPVGFLGVDFPSLLREAYAAALNEPSTDTAMPLILAVPYECGAESAEHLSYHDLGAQRHCSRSPQVGSATDLCTVFSTSGTTGVPKLPAHDQASTAFHMTAVAEAFELGRGDVMLCSLPLCGAFGLTLALASIAGVATCILQPLFDATDAADGVTHGGVTHFFGGDDMVLAVLGELDRREGPTRWRLGGFGDFSGRGEELVQYAEDGAGVHLTGMYGSSEGFALMSRWPADTPVSTRAAAGGRLIDPRMAVRVADPGSGEPLGHHTTGQLQFRGPNLFTCYLGADDLTASAFTADGWFRSGDLGETVADDAFVYRGRIEDSLRVRGFLVDPREIELQLATHPAVRAAQVVGASPIDDAPERAVAFVMLHPGQRSSEDDLRLHCRGEIADFKIPERIIAVDRFPTRPTPNGHKVQKAQLREQARAALQDGGPTHA